MSEINLPTLKLALSPVAPPIQPPPLFPAHPPGKDKKVSNAHRPSALLVRGRAELLDKLVKGHLGQHGVEFGVERVARAGGHLGRGNEHFVLFGSVSSNCHNYLTVKAQICSVKYTIF